MKRVIFISWLLWMAVIGLSACSGKFWGGAASGAGLGTLGTGGGYEINARRQMDRIKDDLNAGTIDQREYDIRKDQIQRMSVTY